jgi:flagellar hook-length control protein FliK
MSTVQFEPKIATELPIDWRRPASSQASDMFADLLKQRFAEDHPAPTAKRRPAAADAMSGRPPRLVVAHPRTLRGDAKEVEDAGARLADQRPCQGEDGCAPSAEVAAAIDEGADEAETAGRPESTEPAVETGTDADSAAPEQTAIQEETAADPAATAVVATQPAEQVDGVPTQEVMEITFAPASPDEQAIAPEQAVAEPDGASGESEPGSDAAVEQQAVEAALQAGLSEVAVAPDGGDATPVVDGEMPVALAQPEAAPPATTDESLPGAPHAPDPVGELVPSAVHPRPDRTSMDIKIRQGSPRAQPATAADPKPAPPATQSAPPHQPVPLQPAASGELGGSGDAFEHPLSPEGSGPGWTLHLAQGAASRRADFVAQLRQHLQNLPAHEQVAVHMQRAAREGTGRVSIQLSPAELGRIHVKMEIDEEKRVTAAVTVERPSTLELLQRDIRGLERALHNAGLTMEGGDLSFSLGRGSDQDFAQELGQSAVPAVDGTIPEDEVQGGQPASPVAEVMDTAAGVVNLQV